MRLIPCLLVFALTAPVFAQQEGEWIELFDGKSFDGWKMAEENQDSWSIQDGAIVANGPRSHLFYEAEKPFKNFEFEAEVMTKPNSNGGIYFHTDYLAEGWPVGGFEAQVNNTFERDPKKTGSLYLVVNNLQAPAEDNTWFKYSIRVEGNYVRIEIDSKPVVDYYEPKGAQPGDDFERVLSEGTFALQAHDPGSTVYIRNLRARHLN